MFSYLMISTVIENLVLFKFFYSLIRQPSHFGILVCRLIEMCLSSFCLIYFLSFWLMTALWLRSNHKTFSFGTISRSIYHFFCWLKILYAIFQHSCQWEMQYITYTKVLLLTIIISTFLWNVNIKWTHLSHS